MFYAIQNILRAVAVGVIMLNLYLGAKGGNWWTFKLNQIVEDKGNNISSSLSLVLVMNILQNELPIFQLSYNFLFNSI